MQFNTTLMKAPTKQHKQENTRSSKFPGKGSDNNHDGIGLSPRVLVIAATNRPEDCDPALLRRFGIRLKVGLPSCRDRKKMFTKHLSGIEHILSTSDLHNMALSTEGWSGSDIESLAREAAMAPVRECLQIAAIQRRRNSREEVGRGQSSFPDDDLVKTSGDSSNRPNPNDAQQLLLESLENLRPVRIDDFEYAIGALSKGEFISRCVGHHFGTKRFETHYDSSSDEELA